MKRYTETELEKIVRIGLCRIDQIMDRACAELEEIKPKALKDERRENRHFSSEWLRALRYNLDANTLFDARSLQRGAMLESQNRELNRTALLNGQSNFGGLQGQDLLGLRGIK
jgi:hypothetical protein